MDGRAFDRIYDVVRKIPSGKVATYGQVAELAGNKKWSRVVGYALHANPDPDHIPCYRVEPVWRGVKGFCIWRREPTAGTARS